MKIAITAGGFYPYDFGGHEIRINKLTSELSRQGHKVHVYILSNKSYPNYHNNIRIFSITPDVGSQKLKRNLGRYIFRRKLKNKDFSQYDLVDSYIPIKKSDVGVTLINTYGAFIERWKNIHSLFRKTLVTIPTVIEYLSKRQCIPTSDGVISVSDFSQQEYKRLFGPRYKDSVIKNGVDPKHHTPKGEKQNLAEKSKFIGLYAGRLHKEKGVFELLKSVKHTQKSFSLVIVGEGNEREKLQELAREYSIEDRVLFVGKVEYKQLPSYYRAADIFILPSYFEIQPLTCLEAMACGTPPIANDIKGTKELINNKQNGLIIDTTDPTNIAKAIDNLANNQKLYESVRENGIEFAKKRTWRKIATQTSDFYSELISS